jgi:hypothetical protein
MIERVDFYSDDEYQQALQWEEEYFKEQQALAEYEAELAYQEFLNETK